MTKPHRKSDPRLAGTAGNTTDGEGPVRQCAVTRERLAQTEMVRFVLSPDMVVTPDINAKLPGRGVWVKADRDTVALAATKGAFARGFKEKVKVPDGLVDQVEDLLLKRCQNILGMAKKAGGVILGYDQVKDALRKKTHGILLEASDGAEDGRNKVYFLAKALYSSVNVAGALSSVELGMAFGRERVIHGLIRKGAIAKTWTLAYRRLTGFRESPELNWFKDQDRT
ncbi:RNA-binding protein [Hyphomonas sp.]|jgi:predicted RNA-binding protein YlxR (DUF448 family)/ribosomal protein L30E|uniref:RNA-binding protein n=1 Tax=Hyphomonas sp. TaxID=87 RepID=UPI0039E50B65